MLVIRPGFPSSADRIELKAGLRRQREDHGIAGRANAILLLDDGESCARIANFSTLTTIPSGTGIRATGKMARMRLAVSRLLSLDGRDQGRCRS